MAAKKKTKSKKEEVYYQQGDVLLFKIDSLPKDDLKEHHEPVVAYGEVTGHSHKLKGKAKVLRSKNNEVYVDVLEDSTIEHEEHNPISIPKGKYISRIVRERNHFLNVTRSVVD